MSDNDTGVAESKILVRDVPAAAMPKSSPTVAGIGRVLLVYCPQLWNGAQPGLVTREGVRRGVAVIGAATDGESTAETEMQACTVNALVDGASNPGALKFWRERPQGNTLTVVPVFDKLSDDQRMTLVRRLADRTDQPRCWAEWPR